MDVYDALADATRREIIAMLARGEKSAGDIAAKFDIAGPSVSRHLKVLRDSGVISFRAEAQSRIYKLETRKLEEADRWVRRQIEFMHARLDSLGAHLNDMKKREERGG